MNTELTLRFIGDSVLRTHAKPVSKIDDNVRATLAGMEKIMRDLGGAGLAAPQVGVPLRMIILLELQRPCDHTGVLYKIINPSIISKSEKQIVMEEACLSVCGPKGQVFADVSRPTSVVVEWTDENGASQQKEFTSWTARAIQHEIDHLDGILFVDYLSSTKREMVMNKVKKKK